MQLAEGTVRLVEVDLLLCDDLGFGKGRWRDPYRLNVARHRDHGHARRTETALVRVVAVFGVAKPHCAYLFANCRVNRMKELVHVGVWIWLAARRLNQGHFFWPGVRPGAGRDSVN